MGKGCLCALCKRTSRDVKNLEFLIDLTVCRLSHLRRQGKSRCTEAEDDVAEHLRRGHYDHALIPAETVIKERNMLDGFVMLERYCQLLKDRASLIHQHNECQQELRVPAAGLVYAALRCGDLPELKKIRRILRSRFGKEFTTASEKLRSNCDVSADLAHKFSTRQPSLDIRFNVMREIADQKGIKMNLADVETIERRTQQARATCGRLCAACLRPLEGEMHEDAGSTALDASESAVAARTESERIGDHSSNPHNQKPETSRGKEIQNENDESSDSDEEVTRLTSKARVPVNRAQSFAGPREMDLKGKMGQLDSKNEDGDKEDEVEEVNEKAIIPIDEASKEKEDELEEVSEMAITAVDEEKKVEAERNSLSRASSSSVRTRR